jgi:hypothetical protein
MDSAAGLSVLSPRTAPEPVRQPAPAAAAAIKTIHASLLSILHLLEFVQSRTDPASALNRPESPTSLIAIGASLRSQWTANVVRRGGGA